jgi:hypothetical protein
MDHQTAHTLQYFLASLAGIARALDDLGYREEAGKIFQVRMSLAGKAGAVGSAAFEQAEEKDGT